MFVQPFFLIFANRSLPGSQRKIRKFFMKMSAEIILFSVSILFSCLGTSRSFWIVFYRSKILSKTNRTRVAYIGSSVVKALGLNSNLLLESMVRYPTKVERVIFLTRHIIAGPPPVGGGNFVSLIRKKLVLKNKEFSWVEGVRPDRNKELAARN